MTVDKRIEYNTLLDLVKSLDMSFFFLFHDERFVVCSLKKQ